MTASPRSGRSSLAVPSPMRPDECATCGAPTPRYVPLGPVYCTGTCWHEATTQKASEGTA